VVDVADAADMADVLDVGDTVSAGDVADAMGAVDMVNADTRMRRTWSMWRAQEVVDVVKGNLILRLGVLWSHSIREYQFYLTGIGVI